MTLQELADNPEFDPAQTGIGDPNPRSRFRRRKLALPNLDCRVDGCGVKYAPGGVCGYCRNQVRLIRAGRATKTVE